MTEEQLREAAVDAFAALTEVQLGIRVILYPSAFQVDAGAKTASLKLRKKMFVVTVQGERVTSSLQPLN